MTGNRAGEQGPVPTRHNRFFCNRQYWYFKTREGANFGPYETHRQAQRGLQDFIDFISLAEPETLGQFYKSISQKPANATAAIQ